MTEINPEDLTLEEIKEQLALYNRLYYNKRREDKDYMERKRESAIRFARRKRLEKKLAENGEMDLTPKDQKTEDEGDAKKLKATKPRKYKGTTYTFIKLDDPKPET